MITGFGGKRVKLSVKMWIQLGRNRLSQNSLHDLISSNMTQWGCLPWTAGCIKTRLCVLDRVADLRGTGYSNQQPNIGFLAARQRLNERTPLDQIGGHSHQIQQSALAFHNCRSSKDDWQNCITERLPAAGSGWWFLQTHSFRL
uniref:Uncharacterized protein n=2 Tax=Oryza sativa subsp. japonica TaxID=39947 RepID=Q6Z2A1_ORYSJ|nr:hypothetical protein [Oryza sativa Japonica Group]BAC99383.1 hypothetical protein [Oryza sativa Japonica Group]